MATKSQPIKVMVVNGPNLGRLGVRQPDVYGSQDLEELRRLCTRWGVEYGLDVDVRQTDDEAQMVHWMHEAADRRIAVVMNLHPLLLCVGRRRAHGARRGPAAHGGAHLESSRTR